MLLTKGNTLKSTQLSQAKSNKGTNDAMTSSEKIKIQNDLGSCY